MNKGRKRKRKTTIESLVAGVAKGCRLRGHVMKWGRAGIGYPREQRGECGECGSAVIVSFWETEGQVAISGNAVLTYCQNVLEESC
jgi:hypothetical protein